MEGCKLREGFNAIVTYWRNGYEKEEALRIENLKTLDEVFDFICDPMLTVCGVYFSYCDENCKEIRGHHCAMCFTFAEFQRAYVFCVNKKQNE